MLGERRGMLAAYSTIVQVATPKFPKKGKRSRISREKFATRVVVNLARSLPDVDDFLTNLFHSDLRKYSFSPNALVEHMQSGFGNTLSTQVIGDIAHLQHGVSKNGQGILPSASSICNSLNALNKGVITDGTRKTPLP